jgi:hypothetical protein
VRACHRGLKLAGCLGQVISLLEVGLVDTAELKLRVGTFGGIVEWENLEAVSAPGGRPGSGEGLGRV